MYNRIVVLAPHTDDGELGAGGSIHRFINECKEVYYVAFSTAEESVPAGFPSDILSKEVKEATQVLGIKSENLIIFDYQVRKLNYVRQEILESMVKIKRDIKPDLILMPSLHDIHQDHTTIAQEGLRAFKDTSILGYELLWNNLSFDTTCFIKLDESNIEAKFNALQKYSSQSQRDYMSQEFIYSQAITRGVQARAKYAEAFEVVRWII
ncbi:MAG: PIG-L deacetylase family protein [Bacteroidota bacterium]